MRISGIGYTPSITKGEGKYLEYHTLYVLETKYKCFLGSYTMIKSGIRATLEALLSQAWFIAWKM